MEKTVLNQPLSVLKWETIAAEVSDAIYDLTLALGNILSYFQNMNLITPNWLKPVRNNGRSPVSPMKAVGNHLILLEQNKIIFSIWFEVWLYHTFQNLWISQNGFAMIEMRKSVMWFYLLKMKIQW